MSNQFDPSGSFHLHADNEPPSRLDPALELNKNLTNWGMTYTRDTKTPRRTWDNQTYGTNQKENEPNNFVVIGNNNNNNNNERPTRAVTRTTSNLISNGNVVHDVQVPSGLRAPFVINETVLSTGVIYETKLITVFTYLCPRGPTIQKGGLF